MARKSGLGRGLGTLIPEGDVTDVATQAVAAEGPYRLLPITSIIPNINQPRQHFDEEALASLAASIKSMGVLQPIMVRPVPGKEEFEIIAGERRWRASRIAGLEAIPAYVETDVNDTLSLERAIVENLHRVDLSALEEAAAYQQLIDDFALTHEQVADRVGKSRATITNTLRLLNLGSSAQKRDESLPDTLEHCSGWLILRPKTALSPKSSIRN
jgi:ParB family chromosome partitioning protein